MNWQKSGYKLKRGWSWKWSRAKTKRFFRRHPSVVRVTTYKGKPFIWSERAKVIETQVEFKEIKLTARKLGFLTKVTNELFSPSKNIDWKPLLTTEGIQSNVNQ